MEKNSYSNLRAEWCNNLRRYHNVIRVVGSSDYVYGFVQAKINKQAQYYRADNDNIFYSEGFVTAFNLGSVVVLDTASPSVAKKLLSIVAAKKLCLGECSVDMGKGFFCILRFDGMVADDYFLNGNLPQL